MADRIPIAIVMSSFSAGGTERQMIELIRHLDRRRWDVHVAVLREGGRWRDRVAECAPIHVFPVASFRRASLVGQVSAFARWCREQRIAIVHTVDHPSNVFALPSAALARVPIRIGSRRELTAGRTTGALAVQRAAYAAAHVIVANAGAACAQLRRERVPRSKVTLVTNGVDIPALPRHSAPRHTLRRIVTVANLRPEKGHDILIDAAVQVATRLPDARFWIVGAGPERAKLTARVESHRLGDVVSFLGHQDDIAGTLAEADLFVLPSRSESFPNALLEAMAAGLPAVASAVGGVLELVDHGRTGLLVPPGDAGALAGALSRLLTEPALSRAIGRAARAHVEVTYSFERMVAGFESLYQVQLDRHIARRRSHSTLRSLTAHRQDF